MGGYRDISINDDSSKPQIKCLADQSINAIQVSFRGTEQHDFHYNEIEVLVDANNC
jgi:hypothetical protein